MSDRIQINLACKVKAVYTSVRNYDPEIGRWTSKDPILFRGGDTNLFGYVANDPINFVDPRGLWAFQVGGSIGGLLGPILGVGGSAESGIAISYSSQYGLQFAGYQSAGVRAGTGLYGGASLPVNWHALAENSKEFFPTASSLMEFYGTNGAVINSTLDILNPVPFGMSAIVLLIIFLEPKNSQN